MHLIDTCPVNGRVHFGARTNLKGMSQQESHQNELLSRLYPMIEEYLEKSADTETPVVDFRDPDELRELVDLKLPEEGITGAALMDLVEKYLKYSVRTGHPQFLNQLYQGFNLPGFIGEIVSALTNTSMYTYEVAPVATLIEQELITKMCTALGFDSNEGIFLPGGSNANMTALLLARNHKVPSIKSDGVSGPMALFASDQAHYSFEKAANILGLGINSVIKVATDSLGRMIPEELDRAVQESIESGFTPFFVVATVGTTVLGAFDPISGIADVADRHNLWLHVDGALGASVILSSKYRHLLRGIERADSVAWNPHKTMGVPLLCSALLLRESDSLAMCTSCDHGDYLFHDEDSLDLGKKSLQCGRRVDALKLWLSWKYFGDKGYDQRITRLFELATYAGEFVSAAPDMRLLSPVQSFNVCFQYDPGGLDEEALSSLAQNIREHMLRSGKSIVNYATVNGQTAIRISFINPDLTEQDIDVFFENVRTAAEQLTQLA